MKVYRQNECEVTIRIKFINMCGKNGEKDIKIYQNDLSTSFKEKSVIIMVLS